MESGLHQQQQQQLMGNDRYSNSAYMNSGGTFNLSQGIPNLSQQLLQQQQRQSMLGRNQGLMSLNQNSIGSQSISGGLGQHDGNQHQQYLGGQVASMSSLGLGRAGSGYSNPQGSLSGNSLGLPYNTQSRSVSDLLNQQQSQRNMPGDSGVQFDFPSLPGSSSSASGMSATSRFQSLVQQHSSQREEDFTIANEDFPALPGSNLNSSNGQQSSQASNQGTQQGVFKSAESSLGGMNGWSGQNGSMSLGGYASNAGASQSLHGQLQSQANNSLGGFPYGVSGGSAQLLLPQQLSERMRELLFQEGGNVAVFQQQQGMTTLAGSGHLGGSLAVGAVGRPGVLGGSSQSVIGGMSAHAQSSQPPHMGAGVGLLMQQQQISGGLLAPQGQGSTGLGQGVGFQQPQPSSELTGMAAADVSALMDGIDLAGLLGPDSASRMPANKEAKYGLAGLIDVIKMTDKDMNTLALGADLTAFGLNLNSSESLYAAFSSPFSDQPAAVDSSFATPPCYLMHPPSLKAEHLSKFQIETLFYMFYAMPRDFLQAVAAQELYRRDWRFHGELRLWLKPRSQQDLMHSHPSVQFLFFDVSAWEPRLYTSPFRGNITVGLLSEEEVRVKPPPPQLQAQAGLSGGI